MENTFWTALGASSLAALVTSMGIYVIRRFEQWGRKNTIYFICFAAGVLISVSFLHIIPKAFSMNSNAPFYLLAGYLGLHLFNRFINAFVCDKGSDTQYEIGLVPMLGIGFHSFYRRVHLFHYLHCQYLYRNTDSHRYGSSRISRGNHNLLAAETGRVQGEDVAASCLLSCSLDHTLGHARLIPLH